MAFHFICRGARSVVFGLSLFALAAFVSYGRWVIAPF
jgi:hypothetical protein